MRLSYAPIILATLLFALPAVNPTVAHATDLAANANIFLFPAPHPVAPLVLKTPNGQTVSLNNYRGKVILLHFWSINCPACRYEEPLLHQLKQTFSPADLEILGVNLVDPPLAVINHASTHGAPFPILFDGGQGYELKVVTMSGKKTAFLVNPSKEAILEVPGFPTTYIVDSQGKAVGYSVGAARWNDRSALALIQSLVTQRRSLPGMGGEIPRAGRLSMNGTR